jgi:hypothetical protein
MKATKLITIMFAAATLAACSSDGTAPVDNTPASASFSGGIANTRTSISSNTATWNTGDAIGITATANGGGATNYTNEKYTAASAGASTTFNYNSDNAGKQIFYQDDNTVNFTAYYPFKGTANGVSGTGSDGTGTGTYISYTIQSTDETTSTQPNIDYLFATTPNVTSRNGVSFTFNHMMSELTLKFTSGSGSLSVANQGFKVSGVNFLTGMFNTATGVAAINGSTASSLSLATDASGSSTMIVYPNSALKSGMIVEVTISGVTYKASLDFTGINPAVGEGSATDGMLPGKNYTFNITVNATGLTVNGQSISGWTAVSNNISATAE